MRYTKGLQWKPWFNQIVISLLTKDKATSGQICKDWNKSVYGHQCRRACEELSKLYGLVKSTKSDKPQLGAKDWHLDTGVFCDMLYDYHLSQSTILTTTKKRKGMPEPHKTSIMAFIDCETGKVLARMLIGKDHKYRIVFDAFVDFLKQVAPLMLLAKPTGGKGFDSAAWKETYQTTIQPLIPYDLRDRFDALADITVDDIKITEQAAQAMTELFLPRLPD